MTSEVLERVEYALSLANQTSKREGRWSLPAEVIPVLETEYGYRDVKYQSVGNALKELLAQDRVEFKKPDLWRISKGGGIAGAAGSGPMDAYRSPDPWQDPVRTYVKPEGGDRPDGEWNNWGKARYDKNTKPQPDDPGMPMIAPVPVVVPDISSGIVRSTIQNIM